MDHHIDVRKGRGKAEDEDITECNTFFILFNLSIHHHEDYLFGFGTTQQILSLIINYNR